MKKKIQEECLHLEGSKWVLEGIFDERGQALVWCDNCNLEFITSYVRYNMEKYPDSDIF